MKSDYIYALEIKLKERKLSLQEYVILLHLYWRKELVQMSELARLLNTSHSNISQTVRRLGVPRGFIRKTRGEDERTVWLDLTSKGLSFVALLNSDIEASAEIFKKKGGKQ